MKEVRRLMLCSLSSLIRVGEQRSVLWGSDSRMEGRELMIVDK